MDGGLAIAPLPASSAASHHTWVLFLVARFRLTLATLPIVAVLLGVRYALWHDGAEPAGFSFESGVVYTFLGTTIFVLSILLGGVMTDFKESEKLPNDIETMLQLLLAHILSSSMYKQFDALPALRALQVLLLTIAKQVDGTESSGAASHLLRNSEVTFILALEQSGIFVPTLVWPQMLGLRQRLQRLHVIRDTSFLLPIYTLFDTLTLLVFVLLLGTEFASPVAGYLTTGVFAFLYVYMALLVRDLDDPFGYPERYYEIAVRTSVVRPFTPFEAVIWAASIDFFCVFGSFASQLSEEMKLRGGEPAHALLPFGQSVRMQAASRREALRVIHPGAIPPSPSPGAFVSPLPGGGAPLSIRDSFSIDVGNPLFSARQPALSAGRGARQGAGRGAADVGEDAGE